MKHLAVLPALALLSLAGCAPDAGNAGRPYAGSAGSTYDSARNPPQALGSVTYDTNSPLAPHDFGDGGQPAAGAVPAR